MHEVEETMRFKDCEVKIYQGCPRLFRGKLNDGFKKPNIIKVMTKF